MGCSFAAPTEFTDLPLFQTKEGKYIGLHLGLFTDRTSLKQTAVIFVYLYGRFLLFILVGLFVGLITAHIHTYIHIFFWGGVDQRARRCFYFRTRFDLWPLGPSKNLGYVMSMGRYVDVVFKLLCVSKNRGIPKLMLYNGNPYQNG